ncbi:SDR family NAD(P)-dependent oxidoreductase [Leifsonia sp. AG29]|uniref:SDR family NAD(P)-dependent oxidoreductase n=1 Tax=Leifsonia sp. AG29 TaxID=2598860 RepID=UPI00131E8046|nr:SDR family NAD(P)-dependent oxidoreductase [Leifsonia sp. AG29]
MKTIDLSDDVVVVSGGAGDIGRAIALELAVAGARVVVADRDIAAAEEVVKAIQAEGGRGTALSADVRSTSSVEEAIESAYKQFGSLTGLVNAAGVLRTGELAAMTDEAWDEIFDVNVSGTFRTTRAVSPYFRAAGRGSIVNLSSVSAFIGSADGAAYTSTKGAVLSFTIGTAGELAPYGIRVNAVCPGWVDGGFTHQAMEGSENPEALEALAVSLHPLGRMAKTTDVANAVAWLMSPLASFITGTALFVDGGFMIQHH